MDLIGLKLARTLVFSMGSLGLKLARTLVFSMGFLYRAPNQLQVGEDHDLGWHSSYYLCNCVVVRIYPIFIFFAQRTNKTPC
jgi:hypothetical protein